MRTLLLLAALIVVVGAVVVAVERQPSDKPSGACDTRPHVEAKDCWWNSEPLPPGPPEFEFELPSTWNRLEPTVEWTEQGIVQGGMRRLDTLKDGTEARGEGGLVHLSVTDVPLDLTLDQAVQDPEVLRFLLGRFGDRPSDWPSIRELDMTMMGHLGLRVLSADGEAPNLAGRTARVHAVLCVVVAGGRLFRLRMYAWPSKFDDEGLRGDLDFLEMSFSVWIPQPPPPAVLHTEDERVSLDDTNEEVVLDHPEFRVRLVKPRGITSACVDDVTYPGAVAWFTDCTDSGSHNVIFYVVPRGGREVDGFVVPSMDLRTWGLERWWHQFAARHTTGAAATFAWHRPDGAFLSLPDFTRPRVLYASPELRPADSSTVGYRELTDPLQVVSKVLRPDVGGARVIESYRGALAGDRDGIGPEKQVRYLWGTVPLTCQLTVSFTGDGAERWGREVAALLASIECYDGRRER